MTVVASFILFIPYLLMAAAMARPSCDVEPCFKGEIL
jgi:hypothetical protein